MDTLNERNKKEKLERQNPVAVFYNNQKKTAYKKATFICFGAPRGGTSAVAGTMSLLGVNMGPDLPNNYEDQDFALKGIPHMKRAIEKRNASHDVWGWKYPDAGRYLDNLLPEIENPCFVVVFRDLVATMKAHVRFHGRTRIKAVHELLIQQQRNWFLIERTRVPTAMISYEKAILYPDDFIDSMVQFLNVEQPDNREEIRKFLVPGSYK